NDNINMHAMRAHPSNCTTSSESPPASATPKNTTAAPARWSRSTHALPIPCAPPVTNATRPSRDPIRLPVEERAVGREGEMGRWRRAGMRGRNVFDELDADPRSGRRIDPAVHGSQRCVHQLPTPGDIPPHQLEDEDVRQR